MGRTGRVVSACSRSGRTLSGGTSATASAAGSGTRSAAAASGNGSGSSAVRRAALAASSTVASVPAAAGSAGAASVTASASPGGWSALAGSVAAPSAITSGCRRSGAGGFSTARVSEIPSSRWTSRLAYPDRQVGLATARSIQVVSRVAWGAGVACGAWAIAVYFAKIAASDPLSRLSSAGERASLGGLGCGNPQVLRGRGAHGCPPAKPIDRPLVAIRRIQLRRSAGRRGAGGGSTLPE